MAKLRYEHVSKQYPSSTAGTLFPAVDDISFSIPEGRFIVFLGPSGCGKTTLLKMTNRLIEPSSGVISLDGEDVRRMEVTGLRRRIGYVIQQVGLFPHMTVAQNIAVVPELLKWPRARISQRVDELLELVHLSPGEFRARYPAQISGGQQQRVGLARALAADPELLLMDEPFGAIDAITRASLQAEIRDLHRRLGKTILFVTHDVDEALSLADEIAVLRAGKLVQYGEPCELLTRPAGDFVRELLGADDRVRALGLMTAAQVMEPAPPDGMPGCPRIPAQTSLREALSLLLAPGVEALAVVAGSPEGAPGGGAGADDQQVVGRLTLRTIKEAGCAT